MMIVDDDNRLAAEINAAIDAARCAGWIDGMAYMQWSKPK